MPEPKEIKPYSVSPKGTIFVNTGTEIEDRGQIDGLNDPKRNACAVAYPPEVGKRWRVLFEYDGEIEEMASGVVTAPDADEKYAVVVRSRVHRSVKAPEAP